MNAKWIGLLSLIGDQAVAQGFVDRFQSFDHNRWHIADYDFSHPSFDTDWRSQKVNAADGLTLSLAPHQGNNQFAGASIRTDETHHYGYYETRLKAASGSGVVTGFFTYTGAYYGTQHDEIDVEILGKSTRQLHIAWFVDGALNNAFVPLGFDAATCLHDYGFLWEPNALTWFVNGQPVFRQPRSDGNIPQVPGHLFVNVWAADPSIANWSGIAEPNTRTSAQIEAVRFVPLSALQPAS